MRNIYRGKGLFHLRGKLGGMKMNGLKTMVPMVTLTLCWCLSGDLQLHLKR